MSTVAPLDNGYTLVIEPEGANGSRALVADLTHSDAMADAVSALVNRLAGQVARYSDEVIVALDTDDPDEDGWVALYATFEAELLAVKETIDPGSGEVRVQFRLAGPWVDWESVDGASGV